ncbi:hypothetical protein AX17_005589 [Amanita inopinata Kibby_2008]|nr:hypothetical protein AX17_005589 [Amanita inopinata Kibby_2008]
MDGDDDVQEHERDMHPPHIAQLRLHLAQTQAHLSGETDRPLPPSFIYPAGYWTSAEKNTFFRALARYSRLRPDLIAAHIQTKSIVDVCTYIHQLDDASKATATRWNRKDMDIAFDVSDAWLEFEEKNANSLSAVEPFWDHEQWKISRQEEMEKKQEEMRDIAAPDAFEHWKLEAEAQWDREDALRQLGALHLSVLESILREGDADQPTKHAEEDLDGTLAIDRQTPGTTQSLPLIPQVATGTNPSYVTRDAGIDPTLHLISPLSLATPTGNAGPRASNSRGDNDGRPLRPLPQRSDSIALCINDGERSPSVPRNVHSLDQLPSGNLSPTSRRKLQKRLYMRRKRAEMAGNKANLAMARLRPGRERRERVARPRPKKYNTKNSKRRDAAESGDKEVDPKYNMCHLTNTRGHQLRRSLSDKQIGVTQLQQMGLGLFHLSTLSRLMALYKSGYTEATTDTITSISAETIRLLGCITIDFTTQVIHRAIVFKNQEVRLKSETKAWRLGQNEISADVIQSCLEMMGFGNLNKNAYFENLLHENASSNESSSDRGAREEDPPALHPAHQHVDRRANHDCSLPIFALSPYDIGFLSTMKEFANDPSLMPIDTDEECLQKELEEEHNLNQRDKLPNRRYEARLWKGIK